MSYRAPMFRVGLLLLLLLMVAAPRRGDAADREPTTSLMWTFDGWLHVAGGVRAEVARPEGDYKLDVVTEVRVGLGGVAASAGLLWFREAPHAYPIGLGLSVEGTVLRTWWVSDWPTEIYAGVDVSLWIIMVRASVGMYIPLTADDDARVLVGLGVGI